MRTMRAALYQGSRRLLVQDVPVPEVGPGEVLARVRAEGVCGSDLLIWWDKAEPDQIPAGHEVAGEIVEVGEGVDPARVGERVAIDILGFGVNCSFAFTVGRASPSSASTRNPIRAEAMHSTSSATPPAASQSARG